jgi:hypothetical protein
MSNPQYIIAGTLVPPPPAVFPVFPPAFKVPIGPTPTQSLNIIRAAGQLNIIEKEIIKQQLRVNEVLRQEPQGLEWKNDIDEQQVGTDNKSPDVGQPLGSGDTADDRKSP